MSTPQAFGRDPSAAGQDAAVLRPLEDQSVSHAMFPASFGIAFRHASGAGEITVDVSWTCRGATGHAAAAVTEGGLEALQAALHKESARTGDGRWRVSSQETPNECLIIQFANDSRGEVLFSAVGVTVSFTEPPISCSGVNCVLAWRGETIADLSLWSIEAQSGGASPAQPPLSLHQLSRSPVEFLKAVLEWMETGSGEHAEFHEQIDAFDEGVRWIASDHVARLAFRLTCEALQRLWAREPECSPNRWRLFQLIFLVSHLPALVGTEGGRLTGEDVAVVYFPTGKGKTEAFLGALVLLAFLERLRGGTGGVSSWTRFPVRLLSEPLLRTTIGVICAAELVRLSDPAFQEDHGDGFAIGFLGLGESRAAGAGRPLLQHCPACDTDTIRTEVDAASACTVHRCVQPGCTFPGGRVPVFTGLGSVGRFLPTAVVGTVDAFSGPIPEEDLNAVLGNVHRRCPEHGYCQDRCREAACRRSLTLVDSRTVSRPTVYVPDHRRFVPARTRGTLAHGHSV